MVLLELEKYTVSTKGENKMKMSKEEEGLEAAIYEIECPGLSKDNAKIVTDSLKRQVIIQPKEKEEFTLYVKERYEIKNTSIEIDSGIMTVTIPTKEGVVNNVEIG